MKKVDSRMTDMQYAQRDPDYSGVVGFLPVPPALDGGINKYLYAYHRNKFVYMRFIGRCGGG
jgi:hypothetical protein